MNNLNLLLYQFNTSTIAATVKSDINLSLIISSLIIVVGWFIIHYFSQKRDLQNKKREIVIEYLIKTYRVLACDILQRKLTSAESKKALEDILSDLQLIGSKEQVEMAKQLADAAVRGSGIIDLSPIINNLRQSLRKELKLKQIDGNITWLRLNRNEKKGSAKNR